LTISHPPAENVTEPLLIYSTTSIIITDTCTFEKEERRMKERKKERKKIFSLQH